MVGFALKIYFDFSGYTDMARGLGWLLGLDFVINFDAPYRALDPSDFWRRWHISLSTWLRDYLYVPLGGSRRGPSRTYVNLMLTMVLGGLWHGAGWNFLAWGVLHGAALALYRRFTGAWDGLPAGVRWCAMSVFIVLSWVPFRLHGLDQIVTCYWVMFSALPLSGAVPAQFVAPLAVAVVVAVGIRKTSNEIQWEALSPLPAAALGVLTFGALFYLNSSRRFLYFQF